MQRAPRPALLALVSLLLACSPDPRPQLRADAANADDASLAADAAAPIDGPSALTLSAPSTATACAAFEVQVSGEQPAGASWRVTGAPLVTSEATATGLRVRAPSVARVTPLMFSLGDTASVTVTIRPTATEGDQALGLAHDCAPFSSGVASGDPTTDSVVLWTRLDPPMSAAPAQVRWQVALDPTFGRLVVEGEATAAADRDYTVQVSVSALPPGETLYYRFTTLDGAHSRLGRTRTLPTATPERARLAVTSCSSLFSGFFNAYARLAERNDLDLVIHLGDYIYDFVDEDEQVRVPPDESADPNTLSAWRARHRLYLRDPDLRAARAAHPWLVMWDNHDVDAGDGGDPRDPIQAFREYVPMVAPVPEDPRVSYRGVRFGDLVDIALMDVLLHRTPAMQTAPPDLLGAAQWAWLEARLAGPPAAWRVLGSQKLMTTLAYPAIGLPTASDWDDHPASRTRLLTRLAALGDNVVLSGDLHFTIANDLVDAPLSAEARYDPASGEGSVGVELLASGVSRGNVDETACMGACGPGSEALFENIRGLVASMNPHNRFLDLTQHGYGVVDITAERVVAELWYSRVRAADAQETLGATLVTRRGEHRWVRDPSP